ncbi:MAG: SpvB/TcaC N-terminal domain-containing protein [bacterium]
MLTRDNQGTSNRSQQPVFATSQTSQGGKGQQGGEPREGAQETAGKLLPSISVPKGGGAIRGIDEKFSVNPATGTGSLSIPLPVSPSRANFNPQLTLSYSSGAGNGPFGLGWDLSVPAITRKTDKGLAKYQDVKESDILKSEVTKSDVFILSGAEDLVPALKFEDGEWKRDFRPEGEYHIQRYRPRTEGLFTRIEKWTRISGHPESIGEVHWRATTKDNITSIYGRSANSRIFDPEDPTHVFSWLLEESYDDKGNVIVYEYKQENRDGIDPTLPQEGKRLRSSKSFANKYLKRVKYGNRLPSVRDDWLFEAVLDYGEHDAANPQPAESRAWPVRQDPFSTYRAGFEIRTYRLCHRVLMFHHFETDPLLVRSLDFTYEPHPHLTYLMAATQKGYVKDGGAYRSKALPPLEFDYTRFPSEKKINEEPIGEVDTESLENLPIGIDDANYQWIDIDGEGLSGVLTQNGEAWYFKRNLGNARFAPIERLTSHPAHAALQSPRTQIMDIDGNGMKELVLLDDPITGFYEKNHENGWDEFVVFQHEPNVDWGDPNLRMIDLTGDGHADILISNDESFLYFPSKADEGFDAPTFIRKALDEEEGPALVFADRSQSIFLADMSGDGMTDIARIRNGEVCYWPNLGYGRFGAKIIMDTPPFFDHPDQFDPRRLRLADIDGSGTTDIIYLNAGSIRIYLNQAGNDWSAPIELENFPAVDNLSTVSVMDLLGNGTSCIVWSSPLQRDANRPMRYIDLMGGQKPHLLITSRNNMGSETRLKYASSTKFYLQDRLDGKPWITKLPFPVHVVERVETYDYISRNRFVTRYAFHHGFFDGIEREFRGFGYVEQFDTESFAAYNGKGLFADPPKVVDEEFFQPPVVTRTWFHTGAYLRRDNISQHYAEEYYKGDGEAILLDDTMLPESLTAEEEREACRALKGRMLRQEVYAEDDSLQHAHPYTVTEQNFQLRLVQPQLDQRHAVLLGHSNETLAYHYERKHDDPRMAHQMVLEVDDFGNVLKSAAIVYPRRAPVYPEQGKTLVTYTESEVINKPDKDDWYRLGLPAETLLYELTGLPAPTGQIYSIAEITSFLTAATDIPYEATPSEGIRQKRLVERQRTLYLKNDLTGPSDFKEVESLALPYETYRLALSSDLLAGVFDGPISSGRVTSAELARIIRVEGKYVDLLKDGHWWIPSGRVFFSPVPKPTPDPIVQDPVFASAHFYLAQATQDPFSNVSRITYDGYDLLLMQADDAVENVVSAVNDYRVLQPKLVTDPNDNRVEVAFDELGLVIKTAVMEKKGETDPAKMGDTIDDPTTRLEYEMFNWMNHQKPNFVHTFARERHRAADTRWQESYAYSDGLGREVMTKIQAEPGFAPGRDADGNLLRDAGGNLVLVDTSPNVRWVGTGRTVFDNKGNAIKKYEPFFSITHAYESEKDLVEWGVTPILDYDPLGCLIRTDLPNGTFSKVEFDAWQQTTYDENDTVLESEWYEKRGSPALTGAEPTDPEIRAAWLAAKHANTPTVAHLDTLGRTFLTIAKNGLTPADEYRTHVELDIEGNALAITDVRNNRVMEYRVRKTNGVERLTTAYDLAGQLLYQKSMDAGERWMIANVAGNLIHGWDSLRRHTSRKYDELHRPIELRVLFENTGTEILAEKTDYGEDQTNDKARNLRGRVFKIFDGAGVVTSETYDFKGNLLAGTRQLAKQYRTAIDWKTSPALETETFSTATEYDALNRPVSLTTPDRSVIRPKYNEANLLEQVHVNLRGATTATPFVNDIDYNAKGQRELIEYGSGVTTTYTYDPLTFRLINLKAIRGTDTRLQDLFYIYDPVGNITEIRDDAQQKVYFENTVVEPHSKYEYDPLYRLIYAEGREHGGLYAQTQRTHLDPPMNQLPHPHDAQALWRYRESYEYDEVGNILEIFHRSNGSEWTNRFEYATNNNRLLSLNIPGYGFSYDLHGNMTHMPHLANHPDPEAPNMHWDFKDQLHQVDLGGGGTAYYVYDAAGQRVRKVHEHNGSTVEERIYLGGFEIYRKRNASDLVLERETLHIMDDQRRIALVETKTIDTNDPPLTPTPVLRYQLDNHLGSACVETDERGKVISYEEYHPYGTTSYQAGRNVAEVSLKRYRYTGKERDEETGLYYHGARYYAPWLGRWASSDPAGMVDGVNLYRYVAGNPLRFADPSGRWEDERLPVPPPQRRNVDIQIGEAVLEPNINTSEVLAEIEAIRAPTIPQGPWREQGNELVRLIEHRDTPTGWKVTFFVFAVINEPFALAEDAIIGVLNIPSNLYNAGNDLGAAAVATETGESERYLQRAGHELLDVTEAGFTVYSLGAGQFAGRTAATAAGTVAGPTIIEANALEGLHLGRANVLSGIRNQRATVLANFQDALERSFGPIDWTLHENRQLAYSYSLANIERYQGPIVSHLEGVFLRTGGGGQVSRAEIRLLLERPDLLERTTFLFGRTQVPTPFVRVLSAIGRNP